jgi:hypothetical protein
MLARVEEARRSEVAVLDGGVGAGARIGLRDVEALPRDVVREVAGGGRVEGLHPGEVTGGAALEDVSFVDLDEDAEVPVRVELRAEREDAVCNEDGVR